jgi:hypothetical protein
MGAERLPKADAATDALASARGEVERDLERRISEVGTREGEAVVRTLDVLERLVGDLIDVGDGDAPGNRAALVRDVRSALTEHQQAQDDHRSAVRELAGYAPFDPLRVLLTDIAAGHLDWVTSR